MRSAGPKLGVMTASWTSEGEPAVVDWWRPRLRSGHFIQQCPTNGNPVYDVKRVKAPAGIPRTRLRAEEGGSYMMPDGSTAAMQPDE